MSHLGAAKTRTFDGTPGSSISTPFGKLWLEAGERFEMAAYGYLMQYNSPQAGLVPLTIYTNQSHQYGTNDCYIKANAHLRSILKNFGIFLN